MTEATWRGAVTRLRLVISTRLITVLALLPLASGFGEDGKIWAPLGHVVVAELFTLFLIPTLYSLITENYRSKTPAHQSNGRCQAAFSSSIRLAMTLSPPRPVAVNSGPSCTTPISPHEPAGMMSRNAAP